MQLSIPVLEGNRMDHNLDVVALQAIDIYMACLENPNVLDYYAEVMEGMSCLAWEAMNARMNMEASNPLAVPRLDGMGQF